MDGYVYNYDLSISIGSQALSDIKSWQMIAISQQLISSISFTHDLTSPLED